ncbi:MAG TPA: hypothetical protein VMY39_03850, partial [Planctomycetota bacterium]|nr:hypothetical protein [Planctomycetota bacterium]
MTEETPQHDTPEILPGLATQATRGRRFIAVAGLTSAALFSGFLVAGIVFAALEGGGGVVTQTDLLVKLKTLSQEKDPKVETLKQLVADERKRIAEGRAAPSGAALKLLAQIEEILQAPDVGTGRLREIYREEDARIRREHQFRQRTITVGAVLLLGMLGAMVACARWYVSLDRRLPTPPKYAGSSEWPRALGVAAAVALSTLLVGVLAALYYLKVPGTPTEPVPSHSLGTGRQT